MFSHVNPKKNLHFFDKVNLFFRSLLYTIFSFSMIFLYSFVCVLSYFLPLEYRHRIIRSFLRLNLFVFSKICKVTYLIEGFENIPQGRTGVIMSKHQSTWETFFLPTIFHTPAIILKRELLWVPFFGWGLAVTDPISINRQNKKSAMQEVIAKGKKALAAGRWILVFPEGTRTPVGEVGKYKLGGARIAVATGCFILPIAHNAGRVWPKRQFVKRPGTIHLVIGPPIETTGRTADEVLTLTKNWIESTVARIDGLVDKSASQ